MKVAVLKQLKSPLELIDLEKPVPSPDEILVRIHCAALNRRDYWIQQGLYPKIELPAVLGSDGVGIVESVYHSSHEGMIGQAVILNPNIHWGSNQRVQSPEYHILGMPTHGTLAQYVVISAANVHPVPAHLSAESAAGLPLAGLTAWRALVSRGAVEANQDVLITGIGGGVALMALSFALAHQANVWVTSGSEHKIQKAIQMGAKGGVNYRNADWHKELNKLSGGFDLIIDGAAGSGFPHLFDLAKLGGSIVVYGGTNGPIPEMNLGKLFWKQVDIKGSTMGSNRDFENMLAFVRKHEILPVVDKVYAFDDVNDAFERLEESDQFGKIVVRVRNDD